MLHFVTIKKKKILKEIQKLMEIAISSHDKISIIKMPSNVYFKINLILMFYLQTDKSTSYSKSRCMGYERKAVLSGY